MPGDLAFFSRKNESMTHVGIVLNDEKIIHSFGRVRVDHLLEEGIMRADSKIYTHYLKEIRRIVITS
jgi:cell wall-associated NlpC family hydrolase